MSKIYRQSICLFSESTAEIEAYIEQGFDKSTATFIINIPDAAPKGILKVKDGQPGTFFLLFICCFFVQKINNRYKKSFMINFYSYGMF